MEAKMICNFAKFGKCKRQNCQYHHPEEICCDKTCQIQDCVKKHPVDCRYFWVFNACKNENSCKFRHKKADVQSDIYEKKIEMLEKEVKSLKDINRIQDQTNTIMKTQLKQQGQEIFKLQSQLLKVIESSNSSDGNNLNDVTMASDDGDLKIEKNISKNVLSKSAVKEVVKKKLKRLSFQGKLPEAKRLLKDKIDVSVDDSKFQKIIISDHKYVSNLEKEVIDIKENLKGRLIDETTKKLKDLKEKLKVKKIEMKNEKRDDDEETFLMIDNFTNMVEKLENTPKNKFRKVADKELENILEELEAICQIKEFELNNHSIYLINESFKKNDK